MHPNALQVATPLELTMSLTSNKVGSRQLPTATTSNIRCAVWQFLHQPPISYISQPQYRHYVKRVPHTYLATLMKLKQLQILNCQFFRIINRMITHPPLILSLQAVTEQGKWIPGIHYKLMSIIIKGLILLGSNRQYWELKPNRCPWHATTTVYSISKTWMI